MLVRYFMSSPVFTVGPDEDCALVLAEFRERGIRRAPVVRDGTLVGLISEGDIRAAVPVTIGQLEPLGVGIPPVPTVGEVMSGEPITVHPTDSLAHAAEVLIERKIGGLPVVKDGRLVGIITESDIFRAFVAIFQSALGVKILIREPGRGSGEEFFDYAQACFARDLVLGSLLQHRAEGDKHQTFIAVAGEDIDGFLQDIRAGGATVLSVIHGASDGRWPQPESRVAEQPASRDALEAPEQPDPAASGETHQVVCAEVP